MEALIVLGLILLNGVFAMSEIALVTARKARLSKLAEEGDGGAAAALKLAEDPTRFLSTVQIGITSIGVLSGIVGEAVLAGPLAIWMVAQGLTESTASWLSTAIVVVGITYTSIVVGELVPKRLGQISPETIARIVARPMNILALIMRPFEWLLSSSTKGLLKLLGMKDDGNSALTQEEIHAMLAEGSESGVIAENQHEMLRNVFRLESRQLGSLMIPRVDVVCLDKSLPAEENLRRLMESEHSRFPVCDGGFDNVLGVVYAKHVLGQLVRGEPLDVSQNMLPCVFVPETLSGTDLLKQFRANGIQMAFVIDEYGDVEGIVTLQDLLEAVIGEFNTEDEEAWAIQREDGSWLLDGAIAIPDMKDSLGLKTVPDEDKHRYHTLSGMLMLLMGKVPATGEYVDWGGWRFEVVDMDDKRRIDKVLASLVPEQLPLSLDEE